MSPVPLSTTAKKNIEAIAQVEQVCSVTSCIRAVFRHDFFHDDRLRAGDRIDMSSVRISINLRELGPKEYDLSRIINPKQGDYE